MGEFQSNSVTQTQFEPAKKYKSANFKSNTIGGKYLIYDPYVKIEAKGPNLYSWRANNKFQWEDLIPAISIYAGAILTLEKTTHLYLKTKYLLALSLLFQHKTTG